MLMGYEIYRLLCNRRFTGKPKRRKKKGPAGPEVIDLEEEEKLEKELESKWLCCVFLLMAVVRVRVGEPQCSGYRHSKVGLLQEF